MLAKVTSCAVIGLDGELVEVEVDISSGLPAFTIRRTVWRHVA
jgi:magnesium chelatase family protein